MLPPDRFSNLVAVGSEMEAGDPDERFAFGLEVLLQGVATFVNK